VSNVISCLQLLSLSDAAITNQNKQQVNIYHSVDLLVFVPHIPPA